MSKNVKIALALLAVYFLAKKAAEKKASEMKGGI